MNAVFVKLNVFLPVLYLRYTQIRIGRHTICYHDYDNIPILIPNTLLDNMDSGDVLIGNLIWVPKGKFCPIGFYCSSEHLSKIVN